VAAVLLSAALAIADGGAGENVGKRVYTERCAPCHGDDGRGDGPAAAALEPRPRNLRDPAFWQGRSPAALGDVVRHGKPGTMMQPFEGVLSDAEIAAVIEYLARFRPPAGAGADRRDGEVSLARVREDSARRADRGGGGDGPVRGLHP
jgi:mono/diheme cytochrome c family protein